MSFSRVASSLLVAALASSSLAACFTAASVSSNGTGGGGGSAGSGGSGGGAGSGGGSSADGLPCDVAGVLEAKCWSCHAAGTAPPLGTYADLTAPAPSNPSVDVATEAVARMRDAASPMPPVGSTAATAAEIKVLEDWLAAGMPQGTCGNDAGADAGNPYDTPTQCSSGTQWDGRSEGPNMGPGQACVTCHSQSGEGPMYTIAGTVYPTAHEPDGCNGLPRALGSASVVVTDANGAETSLAVNTVGNFSSRTNFAKPYHVRVVLAGRERAMVAAPTSGDCNTCHTEQGAQNAPGRIMIP